MDRRNRQGQLQRLPVVTIVHRTIDSQLRPGQEQTPAKLVFGNPPDISAFGNTVVDSLPCFAKVACTADERYKIVETMAVNGRVSCASGKMRCFKNADLAPGGQRRWCYVRPGFAAILRDLDQSNVRACPNLLRVEWRRCDGVNHAMAAGLGILHGRGTFLRCVGIGAGEVRTDFLPAISAIAALKHVLRAEIKDV